MREKGRVSEMLGAEVGKARRGARITHLEIPGKEGKTRDLRLPTAFYDAIPQRGLEAGMVTKNISIPGAPFEIERIWIEDGRLYYTRQEDSLVSTGPSKPGVKALIAALQEILRALK